MTPTQFMITQRGFKFSVTYTDQDVFNRTRTGLVQLTNGDKYTIVSTDFMDLCNQVDEIFVQDLGKPRRIDMDL